MDDEGFAFAHYSCIRADGSPYDVDSSAVQLKDWENYKTNLIKLICLAERSEGNNAHFKGGAVIDDLRSVSIPRFENPIYIKK